MKKSLPWIGIAIFLAAVGGWIANIVKLFSSPELAMWTAMEIARCIGVFFPPLGVVLGYF